MEVTAKDRQQLFAWLEEHMGKERATTMEQLLRGGSSLATKADLDEQTAAIRHDLGSLGNDVDSLRNDVDSLRNDVDSLRHDVDSLRNDLEAQGTAFRHDLEALEQRMDLKLERMQSNLLRTGGTWLFASQAAVIVAVGVFSALG
jgi:peptidoglycan hydrolase CwlO-like protein